MIAVRLIGRATPQISIWFHQHMHLVDESGGSLTVERRFVGRFAHAVAAGGR